MEKSWTLKQSLFSVQFCQPFLAQHLTNFSRCVFPSWLIRQIRGTPIVATLLCQISKYSIPHRITIMLIGGMNDQPGWFIDNQEMVVLINDGNVVGYRNRF